MSTATVPPRIYTPLFHWQCDRPEEYEAYYERWLGRGKLKDPGRELWHAHRLYKEKCLIDNDTFYRAIPAPDRAVCTTPGVRAWRPTRNLETGHPGNGVYWPRWPLPAAQPRRTYQEEVADALVASVNRPITPVPKPKVAYIRVPIRLKNPMAFSRGRETASSSTATEAPHGQTPRPGTADDYRQAPQRPMTAPAKLDARTRPASVQAKRPYSSRGPRIIRKPPLPKTGCRAFQRVGTESTIAPETPLHGGSPAVTRPTTREGRESGASSFNLSSGSTRVSRPLSGTGRSTRTPTRPSEETRNGTCGTTDISNTLGRESREAKVRVEFNTSGGTSSGSGADENEEDEGAKMVRDKLRNARRTRNYSEYRIWEQLDMDVQLVDSKLGLIAQQFRVNDHDRTLDAMRRMNTAMHMSLNIMGGPDMPPTGANSKAKEATEGLEVSHSTSLKRTILCGPDGNIAAVLEDNWFRRLADKHDLHMNVMDYLRNVFNTIDVAGRGAIKLGSLFELFQKNLNRDTVEQAILELYPSGNLDTVIDFDGFLVWYKMFAELT